MSTTHTGSNPAAAPAVAGGQRPAAAIMCRSVGKHFGATEALRGIDLEIAPGTIHALVGENGAGKSTLLGCLAGRIEPSDGDIDVFGAPLTYGNPRASRSAGVVAIYQELTTIPALGALANVFLGQTHARRGVLADKSMRTRYDKLSAQLGVSIPADAVARSLSVADQQMLEIMRAVEAKARVILFDEPTAPLAMPERVALFALMRDLRAQGVTMVFVSHNLDEVLGIADAVTVFRDGRLECTKPTAGWTKRGLVREMLGTAAGTLSSAMETERVGAATRRRVPAGGRAEGDVVLRVQSVELPGVVRHVDLELRRGEILGIAGLVGSGRSSLLRSLAGVEPASRGELWIDGEEHRWPRTVREALRHGITLVPEDRKDQGLVLGQNAMENVTLSSFASVSSRGWLSRRRMHDEACRAASRFRFDTERISETVRNLSGGNQQKLLLARWAHERPKVLLADEPARGVDIGAKEEIMGTLRSFAADGVGLIIVSSELEEVTALSDRVIVMAHGRLVAEFVASEQTITETDLLNAAFDVEDDDAR